MGLQELILELRAREILKRGDKKSLARAKPLGSHFRSMKGNMLTFATTSGTTPGKFWVQKIQLKGLARVLNLVRQGRMKLLPAIRRVVEDDVNVTCTCPAMRFWGWAYIATKEKYKVGGKQNIFPKVRNPNLKGSACKHVLNALKVLPANSSNIVKAIKDEGIL